MLFLREKERGKEGRESEKEKKKRKGRKEIFSGSRAQPLSGTCSNSHCQGVIFALQESQLLRSTLHICPLASSPKEVIARKLFFST